jgi:4-alpha-glucanotransferase
MEGSNQWIKQMVGSNYKPITSFPSGHVPPGWLRSMVHAHYRFFTGDDVNSFNTDLNHGLAVQRIVRETAEHLSIFRKNLKMTNRKGGILLHITSLPGDDGTGTLGKNAYKFVDFLAKSKQKLWQILPLGQVGYGDSPYQCYSAFAGNIQLIDLDMLSEDGWLNKSEIKSPGFNKTKSDFVGAKLWKLPLLHRSYEKFQKNIDPWLNEYFYFQYEHKWWLHDFALFMALKDYFNGESWSDWPDEVKFRKPEAVKKYAELLKVEIDFWMFMQWQFFRQWHRLKKYANEKGVEIIGDVPLYVSTDSADVWSNTDIFLLDERLNPTFVGGVPPDYFSKTGQLWGNPVFNWQRLEERQFDWWMSRLRFNINMYNLVRIDHFRGLESYWSVPAGEKTAINGKWEAAKGYQLLMKFRHEFGSLPFIAEDLGMITPEVEKLRDDLHLTGIKVLQFAFGSDAKNMKTCHTIINRIFLSAQARTTTIQHWAG